MDFCGPEERAHRIELAGLRSDHRFILFVVRIFWNVFSGRSRPKRIYLSIGWDAKPRIVWTPDTFEQKTILEPGSGRRRSRASIRRGSTAIRRRSRPAVQEAAVCRSYKTGYIKIRTKERWTMSRLEIMLHTYTIQSHAKVETSLRREVARAGSSGSTDEGRFFYNASRCTLPSDESRVLSRARRQSPTARIPYVCPTTTR